MARTTLAGDDRTALQETMDAVRPGDLYREIRSLTTQLERIALSKAAAPVKPPVNRAFNQRPQAEVLFEAMNQAPGV